MVGRSSQVARGLNTIAANITQNQSALAAYGISVEDANGNLKSTFDILSELKSKWDGMTDSERVALGVTLAGKNQYKVLASVMSNFSTATEATATALNSVGSATRENARYMESIEARVTAVNAAFQKMSTAVVDSDLVKGILDIIKAMAEFGSTDFGAAVTQFVLLSGLSWGGLQLLGQSILPGIINSFKTFNALRSGRTLADLAEGGSKLSVAFSASLPYILAITAAIVGLIAVIKAVKKAYDEAHPSVEELQNRIKESAQELEGITKQYESAKSKLDKLNETPFEDRTAEMQKEIDKLKLLIAYYEEVQKIKERNYQSNTGQYISAVENQGFEYGYQGIHTANVHTQRFTTGRVHRASAATKEVVQETQSYEDLESAIIAAATAQAQFNGVVVDVSNISTAQKELEKLGWSFNNTYKSVQDTRNALALYNNLAINPNYGLDDKAVDTMNNLLSISKSYVEALKEQKEAGIELTEEQKQFIQVYDTSYEILTKYNEENEENKESISSIVEAIKEASKALSTYAQNLINAANAYQIFKERLESTGDYDDSFKGFSSILDEVISEFEAGQVGSQAFLTGLELLTGQTFTSAEAVEYMNNNLDTLKLLFGDAESGGTGLITALQNLGKATIDENGNLSINIDSFSELANQLGISEGALYSLVEALRVMGVDFNYNAQDIINNIAKMGVSVENGVINFEEYAKAAKEAGMSNDEIVAISNVLANVDGIELTNIIEGLAVLGENSDDASDNVDDLEGNLDDIGDASSGIGDTASAMSDLNSQLECAATNAGNLATSLSSISNFKAPSLAGLLGGVFGHASGTSHAKEGMSLVNEEGPELIQSGDKAYIAGGGYPTITKLHEGDKVYTAEETEDIFNNGKINDVIQAHKTGTDSNIGITGIIGSITKDTLKKLKITTDKVVPPLNTDPSSKSSPTTTAKDIKAEFDAWLKAKKHALAMDEITEEEYYRELEKMNDKYFKGKKEYQDEYWKYQEEIYSWEKKQEQERIEEAEKAAEEAKKAYEKEFDTWLKAQNHALAMDEITEEEYYEALETMNDQYFKDREEYQDKYWQYEEKIYSWRKKQQEEDAKNQEQILKDQIELEKKLNDLAKAKASRVKVFQDGQFRYVSDREALAKAQEALSGYASGTYSASGGLSLVGENGAEMRVLNKGDGILPSNITKNLWAWGSIDPSSFNGNGNDIYNFDISNLSLPDVQNASDFVTGLKSYALQYAMQRGN